jgi:hypothetical protein
MKLTSIQLRKIIAEEVAAAVEEAEQPGSAGDMNSVVDAAVSAFYDAAPPYDGEDPSMRGAGESGWGEQVDAAGEDFRNEVSVLLDRIMDKLYAGEYAQ